MTHLLQRLLSTFVTKLFTPKSFEADFVLVNDIDGTKGKNIVMPDGVRFVEMIVMRDFYMLLVCEYCFSYIHYSPKCLQ